MPARDITLHVHGQHMLEYGTQLNGYTVVKPKLYNLIFDDNFNGKIACLFKQPILDELWVAYETSDINLKHDENYQFTQEEIDKYNKNFLMNNTDLNDYKVEVRTDEE